MIEYKTPIKEDIYLLITAALAKMPDKASIARQTYERYNVNSFAELTDAESMEVLSYCDPIQHRRIQKERDSAEYNDNLKLLNAAIDDFINTNIQDYMILSDGPGFYLMTKKIKPVIHIEIKASVFQPIERNEDRVYFIIFVIQTEEEWDPDDAIKNLIDIGVKNIKILRWQDVKRKLEEIE